MLKRKPTTQYSPSGEALPSTEEPEIIEDSTPEEIKNRKIYRAKRPTAAVKSGFILKSKLLPDILEEQLLKQPGAVIDFSGIPNEEVKKTQEEKPKPSLDPLKLDLAKAPEKTLGISGHSGFNALSSLLKNVQSKKEDELVSGFINSSFKKEETPSITTTQFLGAPQKSALESILLLEGYASVNKVSRGNGFIEIATGYAGGKKVCCFIIKNSIKNIVYQATLSINKEFKECDGYELVEDDERYVELEADVFRKQLTKIISERVRVSILKSDLKFFNTALSKCKTFINTVN